MKIQDVKVGMTVKGTNMFGILYKVTGIVQRKIGNKLRTRVCVEHRSGSVVMFGGKYVPEVYMYEVPARGLTPISKETP
jgi:hypothetical protein